MEQVTHNAKTQRKLGSEGNFGLTVSVILQVEKGL
jgi:hypothetical protein